MDEQAEDQKQESEVQELESTSNEQLNNEDQVESQDSEEQSKEENLEDLSPRQQKRVEQIEEKAKEHKFEKILDRIQNSRKPSEQAKPDLLDYRGSIDAPDEVYTKLEEDRAKAQEVGYAQGSNEVRTVEWKTNIRLDLPLVKEKLDKLDPVDAAIIDKEYLMYSGFDPQNNSVANPTISYAEFVEARIEQAERLASKMNVDTQRNIVKQASQTGVRPSGGTASRPTTITSAQDIANMSASDWEKNRDAYLSQIGIEKH